MTYIHICQIDGNVSSCDQPCEHEGCGLVSVAHFSRVVSDETKFEPFTTSIGAYGPRPLEGDHLGTIRDDLELYHAQLVITYMEKQS